MFLATSPSLILGIDPGLRHCGWGLIAMMGNHLQHQAHGRINPSPALPLGQRLAALESALVDIMDTHAIASVAVEQTFQNSNPQATLALGMARGVCLLVPAKRGIPTTDYAPNVVKKTLVGKGHADKSQVAMMVRHLLGGVELQSADAADALALAICHAHHGQFQAAVGA